MVSVWTPQDGYFSTLLAALLGNATRRDIGKQQTGGSTYSGGSGKAVNAETALKLSAVWACVRLLSESVGAMPINVWRIDRDGKRMLDTNHWLHSLLNNLPNRYQTRNEFFETITANLFLSGNAFVRKDIKPGNGQVTQLIPLSASQTEVELTANGDRIYKYSRGGNLQTLSQGEVWHMPLMPTNGVVGLSPLQYGARTMGIAMAAEDRVAKLASNGFKPTGVLMIDQLLKPGQRDAIREEFSDLMEGEGDPLRVLEAGMTFQSISMPPKDVQLLETRKFSIEDIARIYGVPSILINDTAASSTWGSGISEIKEGFYTLTLQPLLERIEASIKRWVLPTGERDRFEIEFDFTKFLRGNEAARVSTATSAISGNLLTIDEARERFDGLAPLPEGRGSVMYNQSQMIPLGSASETEAAQ